MSAASSLYRKFQARAFAPVDNATLVLFRIAFGLLMTWEVVRYFQYGWIPRYWIEPQFHFKYYGFSWVHPWPGNGMYMVWAVLGLLALFIAAGFLYRVSAALFFIGFTYCFLLDQASYLNHFYLVCLLSFLLIFLPAHRAFSIDAWLRPRLRSQVTPAWTIWLLRFQWAVVYFYGGIAKLSPDWLQGEPMRSWMSSTTTFPVIGRFFREEWAVHFVSYGGLFLDLLVAPLLLWRRTRIPALCVAITFHLINAYWFKIGIFPWLGIAGLALFLSPDWPRRLWSRLRPSAKSSTSKLAELPASRHPRLVLGLLGAYAALQLLVPLRHLVYPGRVDWTYEGHRFSWRMKLLDRSAYARFYVIDEEIRKVTEVNPRTILRGRQSSKMAARPDMVLQFAHHLAATSPRSGNKPLRVHAQVIASVNGRRPEQLVNPEANLAAQPRTLRHATWLMPMNEQLPTTRLGNLGPPNTDKASTSESAGE